MEKNGKNKDSKHHHHHRQFSMPGNLVVKHIQINDNNRISKHSKNNSKVKNNSNHVSIKKEKNEGKKEHKHQNHHHQLKSSIMTSKKEKDFFKYKLENFVKDKESKKSFKKDNINPNMPRNMDQNTEKYFLKKHIEKTKNRNKNKKSDIASDNETENIDKSNNINNNMNNNISCNNNNKNDNYVIYFEQGLDKKDIINYYEDMEKKEKNNSIGKNKEKKHEKTRKITYDFEENINMVNKKIEKNKDKYNRLAELSSKKLIMCDKEDKKYKNKRDSCYKNGEVLHAKSNFLQDNGYKTGKSKKIIEGEINMEQEHYKNKNSKMNKKENKDGSQSPKHKGRDRKRSMRVSSTYSEKMKSQIDEEKEKLMKQQELLDKKKTHLYHLEEIRRKEIYAQENFMKSFLSNLSPYIDYDKISSRTPGDHTALQSQLIYLDLSCTEEEFNYIYNKKNFYKSKNAKDLCRKGIPLKYMKIFFKKLLNLENCNENYSIKYSMKIKDIDPNYLGDYVPYFCGKDKRKLNDVLPIHYLNEEGITHLKTIMWLISDLVPKIEYCPLLTKVCSILLIFLEKEEVYEAMRTLIEMNYKPSDISKLRWHFRFSIMENNKLCDSIRIFMENESDNMKSLFSYFTEKGLQPGFLIKDFCDNLFLNYLNFYGILRFICIFIYEGTKSIYRFSYGLLNYIFEEKLEEIKNYKGNLLPKIKDIICGITDYKKIISDSFNLKVSRFNNGYIKNNFGENIEELEKPFESCSVCNTENENKDEKITHDNGTNSNKNIEIENDYLYEFYLPSIEPKSNVLSSKEIIKLWSILPLELKHSNLATIYSLSRKKVNMKSIIELIKKYPKHYSNLLLIETEQNELFGIFLPKMLKETEEKEYIELDKCFLIQIRPKLCLYHDKYTKGINMLCCNKRGLWFCKQEVGDLLYIDGTLSEGRTCKQNTYFGQVYLTKKDNFLLKDFEIIIFIKNNF